jgi:hypothetical protein
MELMPIRRTPPTTLHEADFDMRLETTPSGNAIVAGKPVLLSFIPLHNGQLFRDLLVVHEHLLHLIITSTDLSYFDHVHPMLQSDGSLQLSYTFTRPGNFLLFADITPAGRRSQVFRIPVRVGSAENSGELLVDDQPLTPSPSLSMALDGDPTMTADLFFQPRSPAAGIETDFLIRLTKDGRPVNDLQPYLGAMAHCIIISQDTQSFLHCHPEQLISPGPDARGGPDVPFGAIFPKPGIYKLWAQFNRNGKIILVDFVFNVKSPILPPKLIRFLLDD